MKCEACHGRKMTHLGDMEGGRIKGNNFDIVQCYEEWFCDICGHYDVVHYNEKEYREGYDPDIKRTSPARQGT